MNTRLTMRTAVVAMACLMLAMMVTGTMAAQDVPQPWAGDRIREASENWADYAEPAGTELPGQAWAGPKIQAASTNWADYAEAPVAVTVRQHWAGTLIHQASMNWADYRNEAMVVSKP